MIKLCQSGGRTNLMIAFILTKFVIPPLFISRNNSNLPQLAIDINDLSAKSHTIFPELIKHISGRVAYISTNHNENVNQSVEVYGFNTIIVNNPYTYD